MIVAPIDMICRCGRGSVAVIQQTGPACSYAFLLIELQDAFGLPRLA